MQCHYKHWIKLIYYILDSIFYSHRTNIYQWIKALITKNKIPNDGKDDGSHDGSNDETNNGYVFDGNNTAEGQQNDIPQKYKCSLSNALMTEPVVCAHNNKWFTKTEIYNYIKANGKLPIEFESEETINTININDEASFLLFDDIHLKIEIEQYRHSTTLVDHDE
eukprot:TRINITY_DN3243_c0_g1_i1.p1 TRINITY_DN3243_c0_g1~~TRINITY_DN3243_c0_g1_i1.p1  ORF type:complete len:165 (-),score=41.59 TRINITY_DN3243_c0_g1_i1:121-615(-)